MPHVNILALSLQMVVEKTVDKRLKALNLHIIDFQIGDFGLCRNSNGGQYISKCGKFPIKWMAIESLKKHEFTSKSDV